MSDIEADALLSELCVRDMVIFLVHAQAHIGSEFQFRDKYLWVHKGKLYIQTPNARYEKYLEECLTQTWPAIDFLTTICE